MIIFAAGAVLVALDVAVSLLLGRGAEADADPWGAFTPEWDTVDPDTLPALESGTPLLDARDAEEVSV